MAEMGLEAPDRSHYHWIALGYEMVLVEELSMVLNEYLLSVGGGQSR